MTLDPQKQHYSAEQVPKGKSVFTNKLLPNCPKCGLNFPNTCGDNYHKNVCPPPEFGAHAHYVTGCTPTNKDAEGHGYTIGYDKGATNTDESCLIAYCDEEAIAMFRGENADVVHVVIRSTRQSLADKMLAAVPEGKSFARNESWEEGFNEARSAIIQALKDEGVEINEGV